MLLGIISLVIGYLLGSLPTAYIITRIRSGIDIRTVDIGNVGAGAVMRAVGIWEGVIVIIVDMAKGAASVWIASILGVSELWILGAGFAAVLGHIFPFSIGFRGGQGVASIIGIFFVLTPEAMGVCFVVLGIIILITRRRFLRHLFSWICVTSPFLPLFIWIFNGTYTSIVEINTVYINVSPVSGTWLLIYYAIVYIIFLVAKNRHRLKEVKTATSETKSGKTSP